ncbi:hypothetical protein ACN38_g11891 [Penicillium nordicum]|uniref:Uncharacterized protein n=1 Tax=Penicillium nordicum TaxID=229535 RepID=A0A0M8NRM5_9EURO|nr:hypothetical protein ACN38_g11891 [Penicillium nordicum]
MKSFLPYIAYIVVRFTGPEEPLINLVPIDGVKGKIVPCSIRDPKVSALPAMSSPFHLKRPGVNALSPNPNSTTSFKQQID